jgi:hypothetical protein
MSAPRNGRNLQEWIIANEFAQVRLTVDRRGNDPRLRIEDLTNDVSVAFDAFLLAGLTTASAEDLARHMDPNPKSRRDDV